MNRDILVYYSTKPFDCAALGSQDAMSQDVIWRRMLGCKGWAALSAGYPRDIFRQFGTQEAKTQTRGLNRCGVRDIGTPGSRAQFRKEVVRCDAGPIACCLTPDKEPTIELSAPSEYVLGRLCGTVLSHLRRLHEHLSRAYAASNMLINALRLDDMGTDQP